MHLYLIRHAETVDNVSGVLAGVRDSALTNYGHDQAHKLGAYFAALGVQHTHIFCSPLQRTVKTSEAIVKARKSDEVMEIVRVHDLIEQDFGYYEGKPFHARTANSPGKSGRDAHRERHKDQPGFIDVETKESMCKRADAFLDEHLMPLFCTEEPHSNLVVAIVSHGMLLGNLWRRLLSRLPRKSLTIASQVSATRDGIILEHLGGWSNTGYLELVIRKDDRSDVSPSYAPSADPQMAEAVSDGAAQTTEAPDLDVENTKADRLRAPKRLLDDYTTTILAIDSKAHLNGLKRQRGGIGRLAHDEGQKKISGFFAKKQKTT